MSTPDAAPMTSVPSPSSSPLPSAPGGAQGAQGAQGAPGGSGRFGAFGPVGLVLAGCVSVQFGGALAVTLMPRAGALGVVSLRLLVAAIVLLVVCRPGCAGTRAPTGARWSPSAWPWPR